MEAFDPARLTDMTITGDPEVVGCPLGEGAALLSLRSNVYYSMNEVGAFVWDALGEPLPFPSLVARVCAAFDAPPEVVERDLAQLMARMDAAGLVQCTLP